jgi:hypothetical protein
MALEKGVAVVVVLDVECAPHTWGGLENKAEFAQVVAATNVDVKGGMGKRQTQGLVIVSFCFI